MGMLEHSHAEYCDDYAEGNNLGQAGAQQLAKMHLPKLRTLFIGSNKITSDGVKALNKADWPHLRALKISYGIGYIRRQQFRMVGVY